MVSALNSGSRGLGSSPGGRLCCVLGQDTLLSLPPSTQEYKLVRANCQENLAKCWGGGGGEFTCDGLVSYPGGVAILLAALCYGN